MNFEVISGKVVNDVISNNYQDIVDIVEQTYLAYQAGNAHNPDSYFLRFEKKPEARIIALPAYIDDAVKISGMKWISSFPKNIQQGIPRASAVLILNDLETGYPFACLESSIISASRTSASAVSAAYHLNGKQKKVVNLGVIGTGLIARYIIAFFAGCGWEIENLHLFDANESYAEQFKARIQKDFPQLKNTEIMIAASADALIQQSSIVTFATSAGEPHIANLAAFSHNPIVLHVSLRDLDPKVILASYNVFDDVEHCMKANTSAHLTEQLVGNRDFVTGTLADILAGTEALKRDKPVVFSPFGMGILDLAVGYKVYSEAVQSESTTQIDEFFYDMNRV
ncbi:N-((2S)-2-amino-2-carboxyethyl)-L-glutamate dehydrogenase [Pseudoalteromonas holothuriae]|uniref:N-((2S)-2-amino-2-carboxyethyl)-L-glutamate dehydrogenase n=1 Tax=Pseudoalteromonas holothuriae TaxID=2963714 RepID=A0A9W4QYK1_9GAMM|nr:MULTISPECIES: 2,3-diaminopropionate biosynthesis protein SbnB [unclassified Pseudoalteromonas]CAH9057871.1 N-((2S)-2-amino-2-carboxyethyl)-L-glutamate dehydrogenase [Pseudoalteromonas sp. CIP111951]CAH9058813.1 N-((2S)-2-amino-2-carboxyethyl)-L-glutamate dehydrogenase [Pseudoalteromonas sp. CIP111854]